LKPPKTQFQEKTKMPLEDLLKKGREKVRTQFYWGFHVRPQLNTEMEKAMEKMNFSPQGDKSEFLRYCVRAKVREINEEVNNGRRI